MAITRNTPKFLQTDFELPTQSSMQNLEELMKKLRINEDSKAAILSDRDIHVLLKAKNRRHPDYFHGIYISGQVDKDHAKSGKNTDLLNVAKAIYEGAAPRTQIIYLSNFKRHYFGFDIQLNANKELSIFTLDCTPDNCQSKVIDALLQSLTALNIPCKGYASRTNFQSDGSNCAFYTYAMLSELAKHPAFHEELKTYPQGTEPPLQPKSDCKPHTMISSVTWVLASAVPLKLITMTQSYTRMLAFLLERNMPQAEAEKVIVNHKQRYQYKGSEFYYINRRKQTIAKRLINIFEEAHGGVNNTILGILKNHAGKEVVASKQLIMAGLAHLEAKEKIPYLINSVDCFFKTHTLEGPTAYKAQTIFNFRAVLLDLLTANLLPEDMKPLLITSTLIDEEFDFLSDCILDEDNKIKFRILIRTFTDQELKNRMGNGLLLAYQRNESLRQQLFAHYSWERFEQLRKTACQFLVSGIICTRKISQLITRLSDDDLKLFFEKFPDSASLKNIKDVAIFLRQKVFVIDEKEAEQVTIVRERSFSPLSIGKPKK